MPVAFKGAVFKKLSEIADLSALSREERHKYDYALKKYRDTLNVWQTNWEEGRAEGEHNASMRTARSMKADGEPIEKITRYTGFTSEEIEKL